MFTGVNVNGIHSFCITYLQIQLVYHDAKASVVCTSWEFISTKEQIQMGIDRFYEDDHNNTIAGKGNVITININSEFDPNQEDGVRYVACMVVFSVLSTNGWIL